MELFIEIDHNILITDKITIISGNIKIKSRIALKLISSQQHFKITAVRYLQPFFFGELRDLRAYMTLNITKENFVYVNNFIFT